MVNHYSVERELEKLLEDEELYWRQRGERWVLEGDDNTKFFNLVANGRRRKKTIVSLEKAGAVSMSSTKSYLELFLGAMCHCMQISGHLTVV